MNNKISVEALAQWGHEINNAMQIGALDASIEQARIYNEWFTRDSVNLAIQSITNQMLDEASLTAWTKDIKRPAKTNTVGLLMAGNIPLVGFHDLLCVLALDQNAKVKMSSKDSKLLPAILDLAPASIQARIQFADDMKRIDAVIATGSNNSARYFEYYFSKIPHVIRRNRGSVALLDGNESSEDIMELGKDIYTYYGLGCRNVSKILIPKGYDLKLLLEPFMAYASVMDHSKYRNNYDYCFAVLMLKKVQFLTNDNLMFVENKNIISATSTIHYEYYDGEDQLVDSIASAGTDLQCVVGKTDEISTVAFGKSQFPSLNDYADHIDTLDFIARI